MTAFEEFGMIPELGKAVDDMEWLLPTDVQAEAIPLILGGDFFVNVLISQFYIMSLKIYQHPVKYVNLSLDDV